jgi:hypothetical protein
MASGINNHVSPHRGGGESGSGEMHHATTTFVSIGAAAYEWSLQP